MFKSLSVAGQVYAAIKAELAEGGRAYIVCPLVDESAAEGMASLRVNPARVHRPAA